VTYARYILALASLVCSPTLIAQCAPGIPSAGNPGCIPPNQGNSPYYQGDPATQPQQVQAIWEDRWGAIAIDGNVGAAGAQVGSVSRRDAIDAATATCIARGGKKCEVILTFHNQCAAVAQRPDGLGVAGSAGAPTKAEAGERAIKNCGDSSSCRVIYSDCSFAERVQ
jgi:hypothetical protein